MPEHLERIPIAAEKGDVCTLNAIQKVNHKNAYLGVSPESSFPNEASHNLTASDFLDFYGQREWFPGMSGCTIAKEAFSDSGGFDPGQTRRHDIDLFFQIIASETWTYFPIPSSVYRGATPGCISSNFFERDAFLLKALVKVEPRVGTHPAWSKISRRTARRAVHVGFRVGVSQREIAPILHLAWPRLCAHERLLFRAAQQFPVAYRQVARLREQIRQLCR